MNGMHGAIARALLLREWARRMDRLAAYLRSLGETGGGSTEEQRDGKDRNEV